jgi:hypothetical protein
MPFKHDLLSSRHWAEPKLDCGFVGNQSDLAVLAVSNSYFEPRFCSEWPVLIDLIFFFQRFDSKFG